MKKVRGYREHEGSQGPGVTSGRGARVLADIWKQGVQIEVS